MLPLRYKWLWLGAGVFALVVILVVALAPLQQPALSGGDKALHALAFAFLTVWFLGVFEPRLDWWVAAALVAYGILIELLQNLSGYRFADPYDFLADVAGIGAGWLLATAGLRRWCGRVEALLGVRAP